MAEEAGSFGKHLRSLRRRRGFTQLTLAGLAGIDVTYVSKIENDRLGAPSVSTIRALADALGVDVVDLTVHAGKRPLLPDALAHDEQARAFVRRVVERQLTNEQWGRLNDYLDRDVAPPRRGFTTRPVAIPNDVDDPNLAKAHGVVALPSWIRWSGQPKTYDLRDRRDRARVYEQVLREGTDEDVRTYVDVDHLIQMWDDLVLPPNVRQAWADWLANRRGLHLAC